MSSSTIELKMIVLDLISLENGQQRLRLDLPSSYSGKLLTETICIETRNIPKEDQYKVGDKVAVTITKEH